MTRITPFELTLGEAACGVTEEAVHDLRWRALILDGGSAVALPAGTPPALAGAAARLALGAAAGFAGHNALGQPVYRRQGRRAGEQGQLRATE